MKALLTFAAAICSQHNQITMPCSDTDVVENRASIEYKKGRGKNRSGWNRIECARLVLTHDLCGAWRSVWELLEMPTRMAVPHGAVDGCTAPYGVRMSWKLQFSTVMFLLPAAGEKSSASPMKHPAMWMDRTAASVAPLSRTQTLVCASTACGSRTADLECQTRICACGWR